MTTHKSQITMALLFEEGTFIQCDYGSLYFIPPNGSDKAYQCWGNRNELMGKHHYNFDTQSTDTEKFGPDTPRNMQKKYDLTYEIEDGELISARLITKTTKSKGQLADETLIAVLNDDLENSRLTLKNKENPPSISRAAKFSDGTLLILASGLEEENRHTLLKGTPGNFEKIEITNGVQGGASFYYKTLDGKKVEFPSGLMGPGRDDRPVFDDRVLEYITDFDHHDFAAFGIKVDEPEPHLDPFFNPTKKAPASPKAAFKK
jgi:hypothetical protein